MTEKILINAHSHSVSVLFTILMFLILAFMPIGGNRDNPRMMVANGVYLVFLTTLTYLIFRTGHIGRYRSIFFIV